MHVSRVGDETGPTHRTTSSQTRSPPVGLLTGPKCNPRDSVKLQGVTNRGVGSTSGLSAAAFGAERRAVTRLRT